MQTLHEARFYQPLPGGKLLCTLCPHDCHIGPGGRGACAVRFNQGGKLYTLVYAKVVARYLDPVEKKPLFHFLPRSAAYSIGTVGCTLRCAFCQNWGISQWPKECLAKGGAPRKKEAAAAPICPPACRSRTRDPRRARDAGSDRVLRTENRRALELPRLSHAARGTLRRLHAPQPDPQQRLPRVRRPDRRHRHDAQRFRLSAHSQRAANTHMCR